MSVPRETLNTTEASAICHVKRASIHAAIRKGGLKAKKVRNKWQISLVALDEYRNTKYSRFKRIIEGEKIYDLEAGRWTIQYAAKWMSDTAKLRITENRIYYLVKIGEIPAYRKERGYIIMRQDAEDYLRKMKALPENQQMRFA